MVGKTASFEELPTNNRRVAWSSFTGCIDSFVGTGIQVEHLLDLIVRDVHVSALCQRRYDGERGVKEAIPLSSNETNSDRGVSGIQSTHPELPIHLTCSSEDPIEVFCGQIHLLFILYHEKYYFVNY
jgi:hypothetical protein